MSYSKRFSAASVSVILILLFWSTAFYKPKTAQLEDAGMRIQELQQQLQTLNTMSMSITEFEQKVDSLKLNFDRENSLLQSRGSLNDRITTITDMGTRSQVSVNIVNPSLTNLLPVNAVSQQKYLGYILEKNAVMLQLTGKYLEVGQFLERVDNLSGVYIERVELVSDPMVFPDLNVFVYLYVYSRIGVQS